MNVSSYLVEHIEDLVLQIATITVILDQAVCILYSKGNAWCIDTLLKNYLILTTSDHH